MLKTKRIKPTKYGSIVMAGAACAALLAASSAQGGSMGNGAQQRNQASVNKCLAMPHDQMMKDQACKSMMVLHPELFPAGTVPQQNTSPSH